MQCCRSDAVLAKTEQILDEVDLVTGEGTSMEKHPAMDTQEGDSLTKQRA